MKVKIKKEGKVKEFKLISNWSDVTLNTWLKLIDFKEGTKTKVAENTIKELSNIPKDLIKQLELKDIALIMEGFSALQNNTKSFFNKTIEIDGIRYGFHPDLNSITLGEWSDLESFIKQGVEKNLPEVMAILYRPIIEEKNDVYTIEAYDGNITMRAEEMRNMAAENVHASLFFFYNLGKELLKILELYLMDQLKEMKMQLPQSPSQTNGATLG